MNVATNVRRAFLRGFPEEHVLHKIIHEHVLHKKHCQDQLQQHAQSEANHRRT